MDIIDVTEHHIAINRKELLTYTETWMNLKNQYAK